MNVWSIIFKDYLPEKESLRESLCVLGNGNFAIRGAVEECSDNGIHYPGMYLAGGYNRLESEISGEVIENEDFVNFPNWLPLTFMPEGGEWFSPDKATLISYSQTLNLKEGILERTLLTRDADGRETVIKTRRLAHIEFPHKAALEWLLTPKNWNGKILIKTAIDGRVTNNGVKRYSSLNQRHLQPLDSGEADEAAIYLKTRTNQSHIVMAIATKTTIFDGDNPLPVSRHLQSQDDYVEQTLACEVREGNTYRIEKLAEIFTSRDHAISEPLLEACKNIRRAENFERLYRSQSMAWEHIWNRCDIEIEGNELDQQAIRLHIFHILQTLSKNTIDLDVGAPSRGLHGEAYRGHILWDELFIFPFLNLSMPEITRELLMYRRRRLPQARYMAKQAGYRGAMFPWQSGSDGREESQKIHLNPESGRWLPDHTYLQRHVNAAIAFNISQYYYTSHDNEFIDFYGAEMFLDIASFWASIAEFNKRKGKYEINHVVGPDEYHTHYPNSGEPGINNNAYTNMMAVWTLSHSRDILDLLNPRRRNELLQKLEITPDDLDNWDHISRNMFIPFHDGVIEQFEGFENLKELDWPKYRSKYGEVLRLDRIMESENDDVNRYKACKQADVLMLFYLFSAPDLVRLFQRLGYELDENFIHKNIEYYGERSSHGSTLSKLVYSWVSARSDREKSWRQFREALMSDLQDIQGGTTSEGIHLGAMAGTVDLARRCYTGMEITPEGLVFNPLIPKDLHRISTKFRFNGMWLDLEMNHQTLKLSCLGGWNDKINIIYKDEKYTLGTGDKKIFSL